MSEETVPEKYKDHFLAWEQNAQALLLSAESMEFSRRRLITPEWSYIC